MKKSFYETIFCDPLLDPEWKEGLAGAHVVKADNVFTYLREVIHKDEWKGMEKILPNAAPIFPKYFVEFYTDKSNFGVLFWESPYRQANQVGCKWHMAANMFVGNDDDMHPYHFRGNKTHVPIVQRMGYFVDENGKYRSFDETGTEWKDKLQIERDPDSQDGLSFAFLVGLLTTSFCHCKNVVDLEQGGKKPGMSRRRNRSTPKYKYHVLKIEPMKKVLRTEGNIEENGLMKALHICRGHFRDYSDKGLFGKHKGIYYVNSHVRGSIVGGIVDKDYRIGEVRDGD